VHADAVIGQAQEKRHGRANEAPARGDGIHAQIGVSLDQLPVLVVDPSVEI
jgi:hypothetical protein